MGGCCFTPGKRHFLWWYWLLLVSIVGIPMLVAVLYVRRQRLRTEADLREAGRAAALIFWGGSVACLIVLAVVAAYVLSALYGTGSQWNVDDYTAAFTYIAMGFLLALAFASGGYGSMRPKDRDRIGPRLIRCFLFLLLWVFIGGMVMPFGRYGPGSAGRTRGT